MHLQDPQWIKFPRWIDYSGLPQVIVENHGTDTWIILRKLIENDCEQNLTPDWFVIDVVDLSFQSGLKQEIIEEKLNVLEEHQRIVRLDAEIQVQKVKIEIPLLVPLEENEIKANLVNNQYKPGHFVMRYFKDMNYMEPVEKVIYLYQMLFGAKFNPKIVQDLEEIANFYDMAVIYDIFNQAYERKIKSLSWVKSHLDKQMKTMNENDEG